jgi:CheY-like chemotaxis protein
MSATILVVDDNECIRDLLYLYLSDTGYLVLTAKDAIVADRYLREHRIDLLLADIEMPLMDGLALVQSLRNDAAFASLPVVFVTSHAQFEARAKELGAVAYLTKPVRTSQLFEIVAQHVRRPQQGMSA